MDRTIAQSIVVYILQNEPQTYTALHQRAMGKDWYGRDYFDRIMRLVGKDSQISATVHGSDILYKRRQVRVKHVTVRTPCPPLTKENDAHHEIFDALCLCYTVCKQGEAEEMHDRQKRGVHSTGCYKYVGDQNST